MIFTKLNSGYTSIILNENLPIPIIIKFYIEHIILLFNLPFYYNLIIIDNYFNNYTLLIENYVPKYVFEQRYIFLFLGELTLNLFFQIFINTFTVNNKVKGFNLQT